MKPIREFKFCSTQIYARQPLSLPVACRLQSQSLRRVSHERPNEASLRRHTPHIIAIDRYHGRRCASRRRGGRRRRERRRLSRRRPVANLLHLLLLMSAFNVCVHEMRIEHIRDGHGTLVVPRSPHRRAQIAHDSRPSFNVFNLGSLVCARRQLHRSREWEPRRERAFDVAFRVRKAPRYGSSIRRHRLAVAEVWGHGWLAKVRSSHARTHATCLAKACLLVTCVRAAMRCDTRLVRDVRVFLDRRRRRRRRCV